MPTTFNHVPVRASRKLCSVTSSPASPASWKLNTHHIQSRTSSSFQEAPQRTFVASIASFVASFLEAGCRTTFNRVPVRASRKLRIVASSPASWKLDATHLQSRTSSSFQEALQRIIAASFLEAGCRTTFNHSPVRASRKLRSVTSSLASWKLDATPHSITYQFELPGSSAA